METISKINQDEEEIELPAGFRFHPTDEELITYYLSPKVQNNNFSARAIGEVDLNSCEPWDLPGRAKMGEKEWYFFCVKDRKYPTGFRTNRATEAGYWKATGKDKEIYRGKALVGMKKTLVFYKGRAPKGENTNWVMHEYRLEGRSSFHNMIKSAKNEWVLCRVFKKRSGGKKTYISGLVKMGSHGIELRSSILPPLMDSSPYSRDTISSFSQENSHSHSHVTCFSNSVEDQKLLQPNMVENTFKTPLLSSSNPSYLAPTAPEIGTFPYPDSVPMQENSIFKMLLDNDNNYSSMAGMPSFGDQDYLWNY